MDLIFQLDKGAYKPLKSHQNDAGFDLSCREDQVLEPNVANTIDTGVHILIPEGYVGLVCPRSSFKHTSLILLKISAFFEIKSRFDK